ncbi:MAG: DUF1217 domain-containing protein [Pseudomonadota bacterium]|nr:DUF1217 domain-containing protein [Pseudomonadota bacterium]
MSLGTINGLAWYKAVQRGYDKQFAQFESMASINVEAVKFRAAAPKIKSVEALVKDYRSMQFVLSAYQLEDQVGAKALITKVMSEDPAEQSSLSFRLSDPRYRDLAQDFYPLSQGEDLLADPDFMNGIVDKYMVNAFEKYQEEKNPGVREAMYFKRNIEGVTTLSQIMASKPLYRVLCVGLGLPETFQMLEYDQQKTRMEKMVDIEKFADPAYVDKFLERFLVLNDMQIGTGSTDPILGLFYGATNGGGGLDIMV